MPHSKAFARRDSSGSLRLRLLSRNLHLRADSPEVLRILRFQFRHFQAARRTASADHRLLLKLKGPQPFFSMDRQRRLIAPEAAASQGLALIYESLLDSIQGQLLFHAGVVSSGNRGMLICGPPGFGKTSLVLSLARRGFGFLSDDYAPIDVDSGLVSPFPRSLGLVASSKRTVSQLRSIGPSHRLLHDHKWLVDPEGIPGLRLAGACRPEVVLLLGPRERPGKRRRTRYLISIERLRLEELRRSFPEVRFQALSHRTHAHVGTFRFALPAGRELADRLQRWSHANRSWIYGLVRVFPRTRLFRSPVRVLPVRPGEGLIEVLGDLQNRRPASGSFAPLEGSPSRLLMQAAALLGQADFYRFQGGTLSERTRAAAAILAGRDER